MKDLDAHDDDNSNPYNERKSWHEVDETEVQNADNLFVAPKRKKEKAASEQEGDGTTAQTHDFEKRYRDLKAHHDRTVRELREQVKDPKAGASEDTTLKLPKTKEELELFKTKNPDLYDTVQSIAQLITSEQTTEVKSKLSEIEKRELSFAKQKALQEIREVHTDFDELRNSDEFHLWAESQPKQIQDWVYNNPTEGALAIKAINLYKAETSSKSSTKKRPEPAQGADSLVSVKSSQANAPDGQKVWTRREINALSLDEYEAKEKEIDLAMRQGRVIS